ncbi:MAG: TonB-dependent receptor [candidate division WOR-3 bacterium]|nr:TonB-dependent receptor [candidate division WOR-3 bacterium]
MKTSLRRMQYASRLIILAISVWLVSSSVIIAAETGRITGRIIDAKTNEPLIGVNVIVEATELGAATDAAGRYQIINVGVGTYSITASYVGFESKTVTGVLVLPDQNKIIDIKLNPTLIEVPGVVVEAPREIYVPAPQTVRPILAEDFTRLPVYTLTGMVGLQAGVYENTRSGWTHIRGGRFDDVAYFIDGVQAQDAIYGTLWSSPRPTIDAIKEVVVITGGFDAEYGEAMSGVIQTVTKEGSERLEGQIRATTDEMFPREDYNFGYTKLSGSFGGAFPNVKRLRYFLSGERLHQEDASMVRYRVPAPRDEYAVEGKLSLKLPRTTFTVDGHNSNYQWQGYSNSWRFWSDHNFGNRVKSYKANFHINHMLTDVSVLTFKTGWFKTGLMRTARDKELEADNGTSWFWDPFQFKAEDFVFGKNDTVIGNETIPADPAVRILKLYLLKKVVEGETVDMFLQPEYWHNNPYGVYNLFYGKGDNRIWHFRGTENYYVKADFTHNIKKIHELKAGVDIKRYSLREYTNSLPWDPNPFWEAYDYKPVTGAAYIQDRADFENLLVRGGLRFDYLDANVKKRFWPDSLLKDSMVDVQMKLRVSPRFGISFPITDRIKFRFSYGHFFKNPIFADLYQSLTADIVRRGNIIVGNPDLEAEKTIAYETGFDAQLSDYIGFDLTTFYKDVFDLAGTRPVPALPMSYTTFYNVEYGRILGFEIGFNKRLSNYWQARFSYTLQVAKGTAATATDWYFRGGDPIQVDYPLDHDRRHSASLDIGTSFPSDFIFIPLRDMIISTVSRFGTGLPYTPTDLRGNQIGDVNSGRYPSSFTMDARLAKNFMIGRTQVGLTCDIFNLLNTLTVMNVWTATGSASNSGRIYSEGEFRGGMVIGDQYYNPARDANHDGYLTRNEEFNAFMRAYDDYQNSPTNYGPPRQIRFGLNLSF